MIRRGGAAIGPGDGRGIVTADQELLVRHGVVMGNGGGVDDDGGKLKVGVRDSAPGVVKGDQVALDRQGEGGPPNIGSTPTATRWGFAKPHPTHARFTSVGGAHTARRMGDKGVDGCGMVAQGC